MMIKVFMAITHTQQMLDVTLSTNDTDYSCHLKAIELV